MGVKEMTHITKVITAIVAAGAITYVAYNEKRIGQLEQRVEQLEQRPALTRNGVYLFLERNTNPEIPKDLYFGMVVPDPLGLVIADNSDYETPDRFTIDELRRASYQNK